MNMPLIPARTRKFIGVGILAASLLAVTTGCAAGDTKDAAPAASTPTASATPSAAQPASLVGTLVRVVSGDTVELLPVSDNNGQPTGGPNVTVHILGIKAPSADACGGPEATAEVKRIINPAGFFRVRYDDQSARVDSTGKVQGYLYSGDGSALPFNVGSAMVRNGFAAAWYDSADHAPKSYQEDSVTTKIAVDQKKGIWATCRP